jgi:PadR family transcriptional regulator AphA
MPAPEDRTLTEWTVLGLVAERPTHGFAVARLLARGGEVGQVWSATRPLTYRALDQLVGDGLVAPLRTEAGPGPRRTIHRVTPTGRRTLARWLATPVEHLRDVRTTLLVKLLLLERRGRPVGPLLARQQDAFTALLAGARRTPGDDAVARWRRAQADAVAAFLKGDADVRGAARRG